MAIIIGKGRNVLSEKEDVRIQEKAASVENAPTVEEQAVQGKDDAVVQEKDVSAVAPVVEDDTESVESAEPVAVHKKPKAKKTKKSGKKKEA